MNSLTKSLTRDFATTNHQSRTLIGKGGIQNEMLLLLKRVSPFSKIFMDSLKFHSKSRSCFGLLSSTYLIVQRLNVLELQVNYLRCPYDIQAKLSSNVKKNGSTTSVQPASTIIIITPMIFENHGVLRSSSLIDLKLVMLDSHQTQFLQMILS